MQRYLNQNTSRLLKEAEFEKLYEAALVEAEKYLNKEYPNIIDVDVKEEKKIKDISPIDGRKTAWNAAHTCYTLK